MTYTVILIEYFMGTSLQIVTSEKELQEAKETFNRVEIMLETNDFIEATKYIVENQEKVNFNKFGNPNEN